MTWSNKTSEKRCINDGQLACIALISIVYYVFTIIYYVFTIIISYLSQIVGAKRIKMKQLLKIKMVTSITDVFLVPEGSFMFLLAAF